MSPKFSAATVALVLSALVSTASLAGAQALGDVAKKEGERRQGVKPAGKVITNTDLPAVPPPTAAPPPSPAVADSKPSDATSADAKDASRKEAAARDGKDGKDGKGDVQDQKYWANRMKALQDEQGRDKIFADSLQSRINGLTTDFVNRDDPFQRAQIAKDRDTATKELDRVKKAIVDRVKAIADLEEEARRAGVPAGWLR